MTQYQREHYDLDVTELYFLVKDKSERNPALVDILSQIKYFIEDYCQKINVDFPTSQQFFIVIPSTENTYGVFLQVALSLYDVPKIKSFLDYQKSKFQGNYYYKKNQFINLIEFSCYEGVKKSMLADEKTERRLEVLMEWICEQQAQQPIKDHSNNSQSNVASSDVFEKLENICSECLPLYKEEYQNAIKNGWRGSLHIGTDIETQYIEKYVGEKTEELKKNIDAFIHGKGKQEITDYVTLACHRLQALLERNEVWLKIEMEAHKVDLDKCENFYKPSYYYRSQIRIRLMLLKWSIEKKYNPYFEEDYLFNKTDEKKFVNCILQSYFNNQEEIKKHANHECNAKKTTIKNTEELLSCFKKDYAEQYDYIATKWITKAKAKNKSADERAFIIHWLKSLEDLFIHDVQAQTVKAESYKGDVFVFDEVFYSKYMKGIFDSIVDDLKGRITKEHAGAPVQFHESSKVLAPNSEEAHAEDSKATKKGSEYSTEEYLEFLFSYNGNIVIYNKCREFSAQNPLKIEHPLKEGVTKDNVLNLVSLSLMNKAFDVCQAIHLYYNEPLKVIEFLKSYLKVYEPKLGALLLDLINHCLTSKRRFDIESNNVEFIAGELKKINLKEIYDDKTIKPVESWMAFFAGEKGIDGEKFIHSYLSVRGLGKTKFEIAKDFFNENKSELLKIFEENAYKHQVANSSTEQTANKLEKNPLKPKFKEEYIPQITSILAVFVAQEQHDALKLLIETGENSSIINTSLPGNTLCDFFKQLYKGQILVIGVQKHLEQWITARFTYLNRQGEITTFKHDYPEKFISEDNRPAKGNRLIDVIKHENGFRINLLEISNRKQSNNYEEKKSNGVTVG